MLFPFINHTAMSGRLSQAMYFEREKERSDFLVFLGSCARRSADRMIVFTHVVWFSAHCSFLLCIFSVVNEKRVQGNKKTNGKMLLDAAVSMHNRFCHRDCLRLVASDIATRLVEKLRSVVAQKSAERVANNIGAKPS